MIKSKYTKLESARRNKDTLENANGIFIENVDCMIGRTSKVKVAVMQVSIVHEKAKGKGHAA